MKVFDIPLRILSEERKTVTATFDGNICLIRIPILLSRQKKRGLSYIDRVYWKMLSRVYEPQLKERARELNDAFYKFSFQSVRYHRQFRRWGSCSSLKNINISHRLIGAPQPIVDYVIIHELAHLKYLDHSRDFWKLVKQTGFDPRLIRKSILHYGLSWNTDYQQWLSGIKLLLNQIDAK